MLCCEISFAYTTWTYDLRWWRTDGGNSDQRKRSFNDANTGQNVCGEQRLFMSASPKDVELSICLAVTHP